MNGQTVRRAAWCLCILWAGGCDRKHPPKLDEGRYALRMKGKTLEKGKEQKAHEDTDIVAITRNGEEVLMKMTLPELPASTPPETKKMLEAASKARGRLTGNRFTFSLRNPGLTNDFVGKLVAHNRAEGTWTARRLWAEGTWALEPVTEQDLR